MFLSEHFVFNGKYSRDMGIAIVTFGSDMFNSIGIEYTTDLEIENNINNYNPSYAESASEAEEIELNLVLYNPLTNQPLPIDDYDMDELMDWLITDDFSEFISDDNPELIYYFKVTNLKKMLTFNKKGYLQVTFKPYSKYAYKREEYEIIVDGKSTLEIYNPSRMNYYPIIEVTNLLDNITINKINNLEIVGLEGNEKIIIDNLTKLVQSENGTNKFDCCNRKWIELKKRSNNTLTLSGSMLVKVICEFPLIK